MGADGSNSLGWVDLRGSGQTGVSSDPEGAPEAHSLSSSFLPGLELLPHYQCLQRSGTSSQEADRTGASDSFHPLLAEVTHNKTAEPSMTFHLPEEEVEGLCSHEEESDHEEPAGDLELSACSVEFVDDTWSVTSDPPPPECLRGGEEPPQPSPALHDSLYQLTMSQCLPHNSALDVSPGAEVGGSGSMFPLSVKMSPLWTSHLKAGTLIWRAHQHLRQLTNEVLLPLRTWVQESRMPSYVQSQRSALPSGRE